MKKRAVKWDEAMGCSPFLNHGTRGNDGVFGDDDDAVADGVGVVFCFADVFCVFCLRGFRKSQRPS